MPYGARRALPPLRDWCECRLVCEPERATSEIVGGDSLVAEAVADPPLPGRDLWPQPAALVGGREFIPG
jgi:hypothetical protein